MKRWYTRDWMEYKEENDKQADSRSPTRQIQDALENAVHRQLMSDVPYGVLLSGGLDSSVISAIAKSMPPNALKPMARAMHGGRSYTPLPSD